MYLRLPSVSVELGLSGVAPTEKNRVICGNISGPTPYPPLLILSLVQLGFVIQQPVSEVIDYEVVVHL